MKIEQIASVIGAVGISSLISVYISFIQSSKKNKLDYITTERSIWRKELRNILISLDKEDKREDAILDLKRQINPYGRNMAIKNTSLYFLREGHIWDLIDQGDDNIDYKKIKHFVRLLLKYDWERSKSEIKFSPTHFFDWTVRIILILLSIYSLYLNKNLLHYPLALFFGLSFSSFSILLLLVQETFVRYLKLNQLRNQNSILKVFLLLYALPYADVMYMLTSYVEIMKHPLMKIVSLVGLFCYEIYFLTTLESNESNYVEEIKRSLTKLSKDDLEEIKLTNQINHLEDKINRKLYNNSSFQSLKKRRRKLRRKIIKQSRPPYYIFHPILYWKYLKKKRHIFKIVKVIIKGEN